MILDFSSIRIQICQRIQFLNSWHIFLSNFEIFPIHIFHIMYIKIDLLEEFKMSMWTYVNGTITVNPMGRTNEEKEYILKTVLNHLPLVTGSEEDMNIYIIPKKGYNSSCSTDEFGEKTNNLTDSYGRKNRDRGYLQVQDEYIIVVMDIKRQRI